MAKAEKIRLLIADDHTIVRAGLAALLGTEKDIEVVGEARNGLEAVRETAKLAPDVVIMDLMMPKMDGVAATAEIVRSAPDVKVILLTTFGTSDGIANALRAGARGAILKNADNRQLAAAVRKVAAGGEYVSPEIRQQLSVDPPIPDLTPRQKDVLAYLVRGFTDRDIARQFGIRQDGVNDHVSAILQKLGAIGGMGALPPIPQYRSKSNPNALAKPQRAAPRSVIVRGRVPTIPPSGERFSPVGENSRRPRAPNPAALRR